MSLITLDNISFSRREINLQRKNGKFMKYPLPENTVKAVAAYVYAVRPKSVNRHLFLKLRAPYRALSADSICGDIKWRMKKAKISGSAYWLRHTYAQCLLNKGYSIFDIKEMMGHESIQTTERYIQINVELMRGIFND